MKHALKITRAENFPEWYQEVIQAAEMAENSVSPGCMVIKPWGYAIWERIQVRLDALIKATGHLNCYFPLFIPLDLIQKEATHVEGFAKEMAVVTHHRVINVDGKLVPDGKLETPLIVRPTSETIIGEAMSKWIQSYRDLPMLLNQWCNIVRWELRPRLFLRTREFLWQEGHTAHSNEGEAMEEVRTMLGCYRQVAEGDMRMPVIAGDKSPDERFAGAEMTLTIEAMMQDGRAIQAGTSHYLAQNFAKAAEIRFQDKDGELKYVHTTSWGASTRLIGGMIMTHSDDDGLRLPPVIAPYQIVIVPIYREEADRAAVIEKAQALAGELRDQSFNKEAVRVHVDVRDDTSTNKRWGWIKKGVPIMIELGPRDIANGKLVYLRRDEFGEQPAPKHEVAFAEFVGAAAGILGEIGETLYSQALAYQQAKTVTNLTNFAELTEYFKTNTGFVIGKWSGDPSIPDKIGTLGLTVRCLPHAQSGHGGQMPGYRSAGDDRRHLRQSLLMIFGSFERTVAFRYLRARRTEGFVSVIALFSLLGIMLGVATLIIVMSVMNGFRHDLLSRILGINGHLNYYAAGGYVRNYDDLATELRQLPGIVSVTPIAEGQALITQGGVASGGMIRGIEPAQFTQKPVIANHIVEGSVKDFADDKIAIGARMAERFNVFVGDKLTLVSPQGKPSPFGTIPRTRSYQIAAVFDTDDYQYDSSYVFMPLEAAQLFFDMEGAATYLEIMVPDPDHDVPAVRAGDPRPPSGSQPDRLAAIERQLLQRADGRAQRDVPDPDADHYRGCLQHYFQHDHAGEGQDPRYRHPAHDRGDARHDPAHILPDWHQYRRGWHGAGFRVGHPVCPEYRCHPPCYRASDRQQSVRAGNLFPVAPAGDCRVAGSGDHRLHGAGVDLHGDGVAGVAGGAARSSRGPAL